MGDSAINSLTDWYRHCRQGLVLLVGAGVASVVGPGCAALHPVRGVPAAYVPDQYLGPSRNDKRTIDLSCLVRTPPDQHRVAAGDVLCIYVPGVLGSQGTDLQTVGIDPPINFPYSEFDPPTVGYPFLVRDDDTLSLPQIPPLNVRGMTLREVEEAIRRAYATQRDVVRDEQLMVLVSLQRPRVHRILVVRQEMSDQLTMGTQPGSVNIGSSRKGTARVVTLKAYENDVMHALMGEGVDGLPGMNAENTIYVIRRRPVASLSRPQGTHPIPSMPAPVGMRQSPSENGGVTPAAYASTPPAAYASPGGHSFASGSAGVPGAAYPNYPQDSWEGGGHSFTQSGDLVAPDAQWSSMLNGFDPTIDNPSVIKIPVRLAEGQMPHITEQDITLYDGDIVFIESRETEVFYTGGLLGGGQYTLPRDYDLRILEALSIAEGRNTNGGNQQRSIGGVSALNQDVSNSASRLAILRTLPNGQRITIEINLHKAMRYQEENLIVQPGDMLILEYTLPEAVSAFTQRFLLEGALIGIATSTFTGNGN